MTKGKKSKYIPSSKKKPNSLIGISVVGNLDIARNGMGYVAVEGMSQDIIIRDSDLKGAFNGDTVKVKITYVSGKGRAEGFVTEIVKRNTETIIGKIQMNQNFAFLIPNNKQFLTDIFIPATQLKGVNDGDYAVVKIVEWPNGSKGSKNPVGNIQELLTQDRRNQIAMKEILVEQGFPLQFSKEALQEAAALPTVLDEKEIEKRKDFRNVFTITIDPIDAKDFDDAISFQKINDNLYEVGVHIADVSYYVKPGMKLDAEAYERATSVYLPDRVLPMLPEKISNELCSLRPKEDKFTFSAVFQINKNGKVNDVWIGRTVIHSDKRFTYEDAQEIIEGAASEYRDTILTLNEVAQNLRKERFQKGAINFSSQEIRFQLDEKGIPIGVVVKESKAAHQLIEEFMLLANKHVAMYVGKFTVDGHPIPFPYRIHDLPDESKLDVFAAFASRFGYKLNFNNPDKIAASFNELLKAVEGKPEQHVLEQLGIRTMAKAVYSTENIGHYGLGFEDYCHFTSPIRRYPDVLVHRVVQDCLDKKYPNDKNMETKANHCSERERKAMEAERAANKYKQVEYMQQFIGDDFEAVISGVSSFGFWAETVLQKCEGLISMADLGALDQFVFLESDYALVGKNTGLRFQIGDKVVIKVIAADLDKRQIDFDLVSVDTSQKAGKQIELKKTQKQTKAAAKKKQKK